MFIGHPSFTLSGVREKSKIPDGLASGNPFGWSYKEVTEKPSLAQATAMGLLGTTEAPTATTGQVLLTPLRMVAT